MEFPEGLLYTESHEWVKVEGDQVTVGVTDYAQSQLKDIVYVELPEIGPECMGGTSGIVSTLLNAGGFFIPLLVISPLLAPGTVKAYTTGFLTISLIIAAIAVLAALLIETGSRGKRLTG